MPRKKIEFHTMTVGEVREWLHSNVPTSRQIKSIQADERSGVRKLMDSYLREQNRLREEQERQERMWSYERRAWELGYRMICGIDEAGRGPLAGPVVAAAVILPPEFNLPGLNDSKQVKEEVRDKLYDEIREQAVAYGVGVVDVEYIDTHNILQGTFEAARRALAELQAHFAVRPDYLLTDCLKIPGVQQPYESIIKGDASSFSIASASILAKVTRDRLMVEYAACYPEYGFDRHKGYGSPDHLVALDKHGPCPIHRTSFAPVTKKLQVQGSLFEGMEF